MLLSDGNDLITWPQTDQLVINYMKSSVEKLTSCFSDIGWSSAKVTEVIVSYLKMGHLNIDVPHCSRTSVSRWYLPYMHLYCHHQLVMAHLGIFVPLYHCVQEPSTFENPIPPSPGLGMLKCIIFQIKPECLRSLFRRHIFRLVESEASFAILTW